jgi:DNA adenine methylase
MKYQGGKARLAKHIIPIMLKGAAQDQCYVEPFVGGCNVIGLVDMPQRWGNDINFYVVEFFKAIQNGWKPPNIITESEYRRIKENQHAYSPELVGFVGSACSYAGKWFGGYARGKSQKGMPRNYAREAIDSLARINIRGIEFVCLDYRSLLIPDGSIVYCDPPYSGVTQFKGVPFDHVEYWNWVRKISKKNKVFCSELKAPDDFECIWSMESGNTFGGKGTSKKFKYVEKLFVWRG